MYSNSNNINNNINNNITDNIRHDFDKQSDALLQCKNINIRLYNILNTSIENLITLYENEMDNNHAMFIYVCMSVMWDLVNGFTQIDLEFYKSFDAINDELTNISDKANANLINHQDWLNLFSTVNQVINLKKTHSVFGGLYLKKDIQTFEEINLQREYIPCVSDNGKMTMFEILTYINKDPLPAPIGIALLNPGIAHHGAGSLGKSKFCGILHDMIHAYAMFNSNKMMIGACKPIIKELLSDYETNKQHLFLLYFLTHENASLQKQTTVSELLLESFSGAVPPVQSLISSNDSKIIKHSLTRSIDLKFTLRDELGFYMPRLKTDSDKSLIRANNFIFLALVNILIDFMEDHPQHAAGLGLKLTTDTVSEIQSILIFYHLNIENKKNNYNQILLTKWNAELRRTSEKLECIYSNLACHDNDYEQIQSLDNILQIVTK